MFGGKNFNRTDVKLLTFGCAGQLSTISNTRRFCALNLRSRVLTYSSKISLVIHERLFALYVTGKLRTCLKHLGDFDFPTIKRGNFSVPS